MNTFIYAPLCACTKRDKCDKRGGLRAGVREVADEETRPGYEALTKPDVPGRRASKPGGVTLP